MRGEPRCRRLQLEVERLEGGTVRFTSALMPGWAAVARTPHELVRALQQAWTEGDVASYARWRGTLYDQDDPRQQRPPPPPTAPVPAPLAASGSVGWRRGQQRPDLADPAEWTVLPDGSLWAPDRPGRKRLVYRRDTQMAQRVLRKRRDAGLSCDP